MDSSIGRDPKFFHHFKCVCTEEQIIKFSAAYSNLKKLAGNHLKTRKLQVDGGYLVLERRKSYILYDLDE